MRKFGLKTFPAALLIAAQPAVSQQYPNPYKVGDHWKMSGVHVKLRSAVRTRGTSLILLIGKQKDVSNDQARTRYSVKDQGAAPC